MLFANRQFADAQSICQRLLKLKKHSAEATMVLAAIEWEQNQKDAAIAMMTKCVRQHPDHHIPRIRLADWLGAQGRPREALQQYDKLLRKHPDHPAVVAGLARTYILLNQPAKAERVVKPHIAKDNEHFWIASIYATLLHNRGDYEQAIAVVSRHVDAPDTWPDTRAEMLFLLGRCCEKTGNYEQAFRAFERAHEIDPPPFDPIALQDDVRKIMNVFTGENLAKLPRASVDSALPVFIVSRPRAGSTLVERIIAAHPQVAAAGEHDGLSNTIATMPSVLNSMRTFPDVALDLTADGANVFANHYFKTLSNIARRAERVTDKALNLWMHLGMVELLFPQARIIDVRRDAVDNGLACYATRLGPLHPSTYNLRHIGLAHRAHEAMMAHWKNVLTIPMLQVNYENLAADQEKWTRAIIDFIGLPWHDDCLRFHEMGEKAQRATAATLSYDQVRKPMYTTSIGRAEKFSPFLAPLREGLDEGARYWNFGS